MIFGDKHAFAIDCAVTGRGQDSVFAHFTMWADGCRIGNPDDDVLLSACVSYLADFLQHSEERHEVTFDTESAEEVFAQIYDAAIVTLPPKSTLTSIPKSHYDPSVALTHSHLRMCFHLDAVGMSSFIDRVNVILVVTTDGRQRLVWRTLSDMHIQEVVLPSGTLEQVGSAFLNWAKKVVDPKLGQCD